MPLTVGLIVFPDFQLLDAAGPISVFEVASHFAGTDHGYDIEVLSAEGGLVRSSCGVAMDTRAFTTVKDVDTLVVVGGRGTRASQLDPRIVGFIESKAPNCRRIASVCTGAFVLAATGLIDDLEVTTHWRNAARLQQRFPGLNVVPDRIWINHGKYWSSAGVSAGIDLALALVTDDYGPEVARQSAREIVVYYQRPGGQSQFSSIEGFRDSDNRFAPLLAWIRENITRPIRVEDLAERMAMSPRNFARQFRAAIGIPPAKVIEKVRLETARTLVETTDLTIGQIADRTGFGNGERMRRAFVRAFGRAPRGLRTAALANKVN